MYLCGNKLAPEDVLKIIDRYLLRTFIPLFVMSFVVCWFIVVMQFLWRYVDELVGKGLGGFMLLEIVFYGALSFIPMALPLGILLSTLMTMGNLGERLELLALKAAGVRLYRIIRSLLLTVTLMAVGLFFFSNDLMIRAQVKLWTLVLSAKYAAPEMEITPGVFYTGIPGYSLYARERDPNGLLRNLMVYDMSRGYLSPRIIRADSGRLVMDHSKTFLVLKLFDGQNFETLRAPTINTSTEPTPYMLPRFTYSEIVIPFDSNLKMQDEGELRSMYVGKNLNQLQVSIDSATRIIDSTRAIQGQVVRSAILTSHYGYSSVYSYGDSAAQQVHQQRLSTIEERYSRGVSEADRKQLPTLTTQDSLSAIYSAVERARQVKEQTQLYADTDDRAFYDYRTFRQEWHRKWTASVACIIFALIGASLGAIVRRGGIGMPIIISIFFFVIYFIIDSFGMNMIRSESIPVWLGMWLSNILLAPVGLFLLYKANQDSAALNVEAYVVFFRKLLGFRGVRRVEYQEVLIEEVDYTLGATALEQVQQQTEAFRSSALMQAPLWKLWILGSEQERLSKLSLTLDELTELLRHSSSRMLVGKLGDLPLLPHRLSWLLPTERRWGIALALFLPLSLPVTLFLARVRKQLRDDLKTASTALVQIAEEITKMQTNKPPTTTVTYPSTNEDPDAL